MEEAFILLLVLANRRKFMKPISLKKQKILLLIPFVNTSIFFIWLFINSHYAEKNWKRTTIIYVLLGFLCSLPIIVLSEYCLIKFPQLYNWIEIIRYYIWVTIIMIFIIICQKKCGIQ